MAPKFLSEGSSAAAVAATVGAALCTLTCCSGWSTVHQAAAAAAVRCSAPSQGQPLLATAAGLVLAFADTQPAGQVLDRLCGAPHLSEVLSIPSTADSAKTLEEGALIDPLLRLSFSLHKVCSCVVLDACATCQPAATERGACSLLEGCGRAQLAAAARACKCLLRLVTELWIGHIGQDLDQRSLAACHAQVHHAQPTQAGGYGPGSMGEVPANMEAALHAPLVNARRPMERRHKRRVCAGLVQWPCMHVCDPMHA